MEQINKNNKCCATCAYWLGQRYPNRNGFVEVPFKIDSARCVARGLNESGQHQAIYSCNNYCKWQVLK